MMSHVKLYCSHCPINAQHTLSDLLTLASVSLLCDVYLYLSTDLICAVMSSRSSSQGVILDDDTGVSIGCIRLHEKDRQMVRRVNTIDHSALNARGADAINETFSALRSRASVSVNVTTDGHISLSSGATKCNIDTQVANNLESLWDFDIPDKVCKPPVKKLKSDAAPPVKTDKSNHSKGLAQLNSRVPSSPCVSHMR